MTLHNKRLTGIIITVALILIIPLIANQFTEGEGWSLFDFILAGSLLLSTGLLCEFVWRKIPNIEHRLALCGLVLAVVFLLWAEIAVGIFGSPLAGS